MNFRTRSDASAWPLAVRSFFIGFFGWRLAIFGCRQEGACAARLGFYENRGRWYFVAGFNGLYVALRLVRLARW